MFEPRRNPSPFEPRPPEPPPPEDERFRRLYRSIGREWVTYAILAINVAVFVAMVASGVSFTNPSGQEALEWGASNRIYTTTGDFWRLYTSNWVHFGIVHIGCNMYVLFRAGPLAERMFGHVGYAIAYLFSGLVGSVVSVLWHDDPFVASAGASGAIFGIFGMVGAFLLRRRRVLPPPILASLRNNVVSFIVLNVGLAFLVPFLDQAAHLGGLAGGFAAGLLITPELADDGPKRPYALYAIPPAIMIAITIAFAMNAFAGL
jgi:rhomboid protease GluP